jgi:caffeoyl-CoA O-methyltransferase
MDIVAPDIERYATEHSSPEPHWLAAVAADTRSAHDDHGMMVGRLEGGLLAMIVAAIRPRLVLEIGTFTGYSALSMASALPPGGRIVTCEADPEHAEDAMRHFSESPYADRIELRLGPALETIDALEGPFDLVFIDADKPGYLDYYEAVLPKLAEEGFILADNTLWSGRILAEDGTPHTSALRRFNDHVAGDDRVRCVQLTVRDGLTLIRRADGGAADG